VEYSGGGDSGQVDSVTVTDEKQDVEIDDAELKKRKVIIDGREISLYEALENAAYDAIDASGNGGCFNNDGAQGNLMIDVTTGKATLNHGNNYTETEDSSHTF
jgi:hypothetical protein